MAVWMHCCRVVPRTFLDAALAQSAFSLASRFGPTVPVAAAAASVWHPLQPAAPVKTVLPAAAPVLDDELEDDEPVEAEPADAEEPAGEPADGDPGA